MQELARSNSELGQFAYVASHDMQEPLRAVAGCAEILKSRYADQMDDSADELISHIVDGASRMQGLINDLLQISQVSSQASSFESVDTNQTCRAALLNLDDVIKKIGGTDRARRPPHGEGRPHSNHAGLPEFDQQRA